MPLNYLYETSLKSSTHTLEEYHRVLFTVLLIFLPQPPSYASTSASLLLSYNKHDSNTGIRHHGHQDWSRKCPPTIKVSNASIECVISSDRGDVDLFLYEHGPV